MKKRLVVGIGILLLIVCTKLSFDFIYNAVVLYQYDRQNYSVTEEPILFFNCYQPYVAPYNEGNLLYQRGDYVEAVDAYREALLANPPKKKECSIRINMALAMLATLDESYDMPENVENSIILLESARDVLLEDDCATEDGDGHSETAETLKQEIEDEIERLEQMTEKEEDKPDDEDKPDEPDTPEDEKEQELKEELQEKQENAYNERQEGLTEMQELEMSFDFSFDGVVW